jgi:hypothetical protein
VIPPFLILPPTFLKTFPKVFPKPFTSFPSASLPVKILNKLSKPADLNNAFPPAIPPITNPHLAKVPLTSPKALVN